MTLLAGINFKDFCSLSIGGPSSFYCEVRSEQEVIEVAKDLSSKNLYPLVFGGGSNILVSDQGFDGVALQIKNNNISFERLNSGFVLVNIGAGIHWDSLVQICLEKGFNGLEALSGIPGWVGAAPIQNIGAYGQELSNVFVSAFVFDLKSLKFRTLKKDECFFSYRKSRFNQSDKGRFWIYSITLALKNSDSIKLDYKDLFEELGCNSASPMDLRTAVLKIRGKKGMLLGENYPSSAGSFFKNPILSSESFNKLQKMSVQDIPHYKIDDSIKVPAAWLIDKAGFSKGHIHKNVGISNLHNLSLINRGGGNFNQLMELATQIKIAVKTKFGLSLKLEPEVIWTGSQGED